MSSGEPTDWDRQTLVLQRQFDLADATRPLRVRVPLVASVLNLSVISFALTHPKVAAEANDRILVGLVVSSIAIFGCVTLYQIQAQYHDITRRILHLYKQMGIDGEKYFPKSLENPYSGGEALFVVAYVAMILTAVICIVAISNTVPAELPPG